MRSETDGGTLYSKKGRECIQLPNEGWTGEKRHDDDVVDFNSTSFSIDRTSCMDVILCLISLWFLIR